MLASTLAETGSTAGALSVKNNVLIQISRLMPCIEEGMRLMFRWGNPKNDFAFEQQLEQSPEV